MPAVATEGDRAGMLRRDGALSLPRMCGVSGVSSPCTCGTEPPVLLICAPGGFPGALGEQYRSTGAGVLVSPRLGRGARGRRVQMRRYRSSQQAPGLAEAG